MWNVVLNKFIEIKNEYKRRMGYITYYISDGETCLERWISELNGIEPFNQYKEYEDLIKYLQFSQYKNRLLIRYANYTDILSGEEEVTLDTVFKMYDGFYKECRSLVIDVENGCIILCPFKKFHNLNENEEYSLENIQNRINNATCIEISDKLDGSMQSARYYNNEIVMSGSQAVDMSNSWRLQDGYNMLMSQENYVKMIENNSHCTFIFEYISLEDAHVVCYDKSQEGLYLIGMRNVNTGCELDYNAVINMANRYGILTTKLFDKTLDEIMNELDNVKSNVAEGFVLNIDGFKVKIKYNDYVNIHKILSNISSINLIIKNVANDTFDDLLSKIPNSYRDRVIKVANVVYKYINDTDKIVIEYYNQAPKDNKKDFMIWIDNNVEKEYRGYVREIYLGEKVNYVKGRSGNCKKLKEMGVDNYAELFNDD